MILILLLIGAQPGNCLSIVPNVLVYVSLCSLCVLLHTNSHPIKSVTQYKDLGIIAQNNLSWSEHIHHICAKDYQSLYLIHHSIPSSTPGLKLHLYPSLVCSKLSYCSQLWRPKLIKDITCLENVQCWATKFVLNDYTSDYKSRLTTLHLLPLMYWLELKDFNVICQMLERPSWQLWHQLSHLLCHLMHKSF